MITKSVFSGRVDGAAVAGGGTAPVTPLARLGLKKASEMLSSGGSGVSHPQ